MGLLWSICKCWGLEKKNHEILQNENQEILRQQDTKTRVKLDTSEYTFTRLQSTNIQKTSNTLHGYPLIIEECQNVNFYILDISSQITIDVCRDCIFILGPCNGSIFIRDVENCIFVIAVQYFYIFLYRLTIYACIQCMCKIRQFRTRNVVNSHFILYSKTEPIIEKSTNLTFYPFQHVEYTDIHDQLKSCEFDLNLNLFDKIHDFSASSSTFTDVQDSHKTSQDSKESKEVKNYKISLEIPIDLLKNVNATNEFHSLTGFQIS